MDNLIILLHRITTVILVFVYIALIYRFARPRREAKFPDHVLAQLARIGLLLLYISGFWMTMHMGIVVHKLHHILSAFPILAIIVFQNIAAKRSHDLKAYAWMFTTLLIVLVIIVLSAYLSPIQF